MAFVVPVVPAVVVLAVARPRLVVPGVVVVVPAGLGQAGAAGPSLVGAAPPLLPHWGAHASQRRRDGLDPLPPTGVR